jgi:hypothetical protein
MHPLTISFYELGQFLRIVLWIFLPLFVIVLLVTTYIHHRRKMRDAGVFMESHGLVLAMEGIEGAYPGEKPASDASPVLEVIDMDQPDGDNLYKGLLWMKQKFEDYREQADQRIAMLKEQLDQRTAAVQQIKDELTRAKEKIVELTGKLENNMSLLMNIHRELDRSLSVEQPDRSLMAEKAPAGATPEAASGGQGTEG